LRILSGTGNAVWGPRLFTALISFSLALSLKVSEGVYIPYFPN
jgi:hypothetical protein